LSILLDENVECWTKNVFCWTNSLFLFLNFQIIFRFGVFEFFLGFIKWLKYLCL